MVCIVFFDAKTPSKRFHSIYEAREVHNHTRLADGLAIHVLELPRIAQAITEGESGAGPASLRFESERALDSLAAEAPIMAEAKRALEVLSREPSAQRIAEMRRDAELARRLDRAEDRAEGMTDGLRRGIEALCEVLDIELDPSRKRALEAAGARELQAILDALREQRAWPDRL